MHEDEAIVHEFGPKFKGLSVCEMMGPKESVITINLENWSVPPRFLRRFVTKDNYRAYVLAHELGHAIHNLDHVPDAGRGERCHFMTQQSPPTMCTPGVLM